MTRRLPLSFLLRTGKARWKRLMPAAAAAVTAAVAHPSPILSIAFTGFFISYCLSIHECMYVCVCA